MNRFVQFIILVFSTVMLRAPTAHTDFSHQIAILKHPTIQKFFDVFRSSTGTSEAALAALVDIEKMLKLVLTLSVTHGFAVVRKISIRN